MCLTDKMFLQTHVTFCEYLVFHEFNRNLLNILNKKILQIYFFFFICLYTAFLSSELISWDKSSRLLDDISDLFFIAPCLTNLSDISFQKRPQWDGTQQKSIPIPLYHLWYNVLNILLHKIYPLSFYSSSFSMHRELILSQHR